MLKKRLGIWRNGSVGKRTCISTAQGLEFRSSILVKSQVCPVHVALILELWGGGGGEEDHSGCLVANLVSGSVRDCLRRGSWSVSEQDTQCPPQHPLPHPQPLHTSAYTSSHIRVCIHTHAHPCTHTMCFITQK